MASIFFPADPGVAKERVEDLTGAKNVQLPTAPDPNLLGELDLGNSSFVSVQVAADIGFSFGDGSVSVNTKVLLMDRWCETFVLDGTTNPGVESWTFAAGYRVGIYFMDAAAELSINLPLLAAKAQTEDLQVQVSILKVGMPKGPAVPPELAMPVGLDVTKYLSLQTWMGQVNDYITDHKADLVPMLVGACIKIPSAALLQQFPAGRFGMRRILHGEHLFMALDRLKEIKAPEVNPDEVRAVYSAVFGDSTMLDPGQPSEKKVPGDNEKNQASQWLNAYDFH